MKPSTKKRRLNEKSQNMKDTLKIKDSKEPNMDNCLAKFPHLGKLIFDKLDNQSLYNCREVRNSWRDFLETEKFPHIRIILVMIENFDVPKEPWNEVFKKPIQKQLFNLVHAYTKISTNYLQSNN